MTQKKERDGGRERDEDRTFLDFRLDEDDFLVLKLEREMSW